MSKSHRPFRLSVAAISVAGLLALPSATFAFDERIESGIKHIMECAQWMVSDHDRYVENCLPQRVPEYPEGATTPQGGPGRPSSSSVVSEPSSSEEPDSGPSSSEPSSSQPSSSSSEIDCEFVECCEVECA